MSTPHTEDVYEQKLDEAMQTLRACQENKSLNSCLDCDECIGCDIRAKYVRTVYESMSRGETGGFDF